MDIEALKKLNKNKKMVKKLGEFACGNVINRTLAVKLEDLHVLGAISRTGLSLHNDFLVLL